LADPVLQSPGEVTGLLGTWSGGDRAALDLLMPLVHEELKRLARRHLARERSDHTIQATALVNEAFMRLARERGMRWQDRSHFFAVAAQLMRFVLIDYARRRRRPRRGGDLHRLALADAPEIVDDAGAGAMAVDAALSSLARIDERKARVVELRVFAGLTFDESARVLGVSSVTVARDWRFARAWLRREMAR